MRYKRISSVFPLLLYMALLALTGCDASTTQTNGPTPTRSITQPWILVWSPSAQAQQNNSPETAFAACVHVKRPDGSLLKPASAVWLATNPTFALVLVHLDAAGRNVDLGVMDIDPLDHQWILRQSFSPDRPTAGHGISAKQQDREWILPPGNYASAETNIADTATQGSMRLWLSDTQQEFALARVYTFVMRPPTQTMSVVVNGHHGWSVTQQGITEVVVEMDQGTLIFAGTTSPVQSQRMVAQALDHLDNLLI